MKAEQVAKNVFTIDDFFSSKECDEFFAQSEKSGYETATVETEKGAKVIGEVRNNQRILHKDEKLAVALWKRICDFVPGKIGNSVAVGLNELFRFYKYEPGQKFKKHIDESFIRNEEEASYYTLMIYLNDKYEGGETSFDAISISAKKGKALVFLHSLAHEGMEVTSGIKYVLRTDIMYRLKAD
jgi:predicted 2-oxoglutarate/Fe(II)-dependent dioxygenase YbiX